MFRGRVWLVYLALLAGCAAPLSPSVPPPAPASVTPSSGSNPGRAPAEDTGEVTPVEESIAIEPISPSTVKTAPHVEIKFPLAGKRIATDKARGYSIRLQVSDWSDELRLQLVLDDFTPRFFDSPEHAVTLGDLVPEDGELSPGVHHLYVGAVRPGQGSVRLERPRSQAPFAEVEFWVGDANAAPPSIEPGPRVVELAPSGTLNGARGEHVLVDFRVLALAADPPPVLVEVVRVSPGTPARGKARLAPGQLATIPELASGDYEISVRLLDAEGRVVASPGAAKSRTITVNRDAPGPE